MWTKKLQRRVPQFSSQGTHRRANNVTHILHRDGGLNVEKTVRRKPRSKRARVEENKENIEVATSADANSVSSAASPDVGGNMPTPEDTDANATEGTAPPKVCDSHRVPSCISDIPLERALRRRTSTNGALILTRPWPADVGGIMYYEWVVSPGLFYSFCRTLV